MGAVAKDPRLAAAPPVESKVQKPDEEMMQRKRDDMHQFARESVVIVDNIPKIKKDKYTKLVGRLTPKFEEVAAVRKDEDGNPLVTFVTDAEGSTLGFAFAEYADPQQARRAVAALHGLVLDRNHTFWACTASALKELQHVPDEFVPPKPLPVSAADRPNFKSWLLDPRGRDMFMIRDNAVTSVFWHDHVVKPELVSLLHARSYRSDETTDFPPNIDMKGGLHPPSISCGKTQRLYLSDQFTSVLSRFAII